MKNRNTFASILLSLILANCGSNNDAQNYFSIDENLLKPKYTNSDEVAIKLLNPENKTIDSIVYFENERRIKSIQKNEELQFNLNGKKLGYHNIKALVYFEGDTISTSTRIEIVAEKSPRLLNYTVINTFPHDVNAFTQGYEFYKDTLVESTGQNGKSYVAKTNFKTGEVYKKVSLTQEYFGEGITILNGQLYQLTWQNQEGFVYNANTLKKIKSFKYSKAIEGWGLTNDGTYLYQSDGTEKIWKINPESLQLMDHINVYTNDTKIKSVNELEWINGKIYGNIWQKDAIAIINPQDGTVEAVLDLSNLRKFVTNPEAEVLNGIAYNPKTKTIFVTGKNWNKAFEIKIKE